MLLKLASKSHKRRKKNHCKNFKMKAPQLFLSSSVFVILLYEATCWSDTALEDGSKAQKIVIPVWARKAGFHLKPRNTNLPFLEPNKIAQDPDQSQSGIEESQVKIPHQGEKAQEEKGAILNTDQNHITPSARKENKKRDQISSEEESVEIEEEEVNDEYDDEDYIECPENQFYHIRGSRCVPIVCRGGNSWRSVDTGECILRQYRGKWRKKYARSFSLPSRSVTGLVNSGRWASG